jgi:hypothetical protein
MSQFVRLSNMPGARMASRTVHVSECTLPAEAASALFQVVSQCYLRTSIVITTKRAVDATVAAAMLDRLLHRSVVINLDGDSYHLRDHDARNEQLRRTTTGSRQPLR